MDEPPIADTTPALWLFTADGNRIDRVFTCDALHRDVALDRTALTELRDAIDDTLNTAPLEREII